MHDTQQTDSRLPILALTVASCRMNVDPNRDSPWVENLAGGSFCFPNISAAVRCVVTFHDALFLLILLHIVLLLNQLFHR